MAPRQEYHSPTPSPTPSRPERRGVSRRSVIEEAKGKVSTMDLADRLASDHPDRWCKVGAEWVRRCVLPDHEDRTPSFTVNPEKNLWWCHGCLRGGDAITLAQRAWDIARADVAAAEMLLTFGHEIPRRPDSWYRKQKRQQSVRDAIDRAKFDHLRRRLFRWFFEPSLLRIENPDEREAEAALLWDATEPLAELTLERLSGESS